MIFGHSGDIQAANIDTSSARDVALGIRYFEIYEIILDAGKDEGGTVLILRLPYLVLPQKGGVLGECHALPDILQGLASPIRAIGLGVVIRLMRLVPYLPPHVPVRGEETVGG